MAIFTAWMKIFILQNISVMGRVGKLGEIFWLYGIFSNSGEVTLPIRLKLGCEDHWELTHKY